MIGGDVVAEHRQRPHAFERAFAGERAFPVGWAADIGRLRPPVVERADRGNCLAGNVEHGTIDPAELFGLDRGAHDRVDFGIAWPEVFQADRLAIDRAKRVFFDIDANRAGNRVGDHQRRRGKKRLLRIGMDAAVEVAVARKHRGGVEIARDDLALDDGVECTRHAVAGGAGKSNHAEPELFEFFRQAGFVEIKGHGLGAWRQRGLDPGLAGEARPIGIAGQQAGCDHIARVAGVGATGDCGNDHRAVGHLSCDIVPLAGDAFGRQIGGRDPCMRIGRAGHVAHDAGEVEVQGALVLRGLEAVGPKTSVAGKVFNQLHLRVIATGEGEVVDGLLIDEEHRRGRAIFRCHVRDGGPIAQRQCRSAFTPKLQPGANDFFLA